MPINCDFIASRRNGNKFPQKKLLIFNFPHLSFITPNLKWSGGAKLICVNDRYLRFIRVYGIDSLLRIYLMIRERNLWAIFCKYFYVHLSLFFTRNKLLCTSVPLARISYSNSFTLASKCVSSSSTSCDFHNVFIDSFN